MSDLQHPLSPPIPSPPNDKLDPGLEKQTHLSNNIDTGDNMDIDSKSAAADTGNNINNENLAPTAPVTPLGTSNENGSTTTPTIEIANGNTNDTTVPTTNESENVSVSDVADAGATTPAVATTATTTNNNNTTTTTSTVTGLPPASQLTPVPVPPQEPDMNNLPDKPIPKHQSKFVSNLVKNVKRLKDASPFLKPVDIVKLNIPLYYNYIPRPMDLSTIERKLTVNAYESKDQIIDDFNLMVNNCLKFNGENSPISKMAKNIQAYFEKHIMNFPPDDVTLYETTVKRSSKSPAEIQDPNSIASSRPKRVSHPPKPKELPYDNRPRKKKFATELRFCNQLLKELTSKKHFNYNFPFLQPVDPVVLNIPNYYEIIEIPMDFATIQTKLSNNQYENADEFANDVQLIFENCYKFNPEGTDVNMMGHKLQEIFNKKWINRPMPKEEPEESELEFDSDLDNSDLDEQNLTNVPAIKFLEDQIIRMTQELKKLKHDHLQQLKAARDLKRSAKNKKKRKNSTKGGNSHHNHNHGHSNSHNSHHNANNHHANGNAHANGTKHKKIKLNPTVHVTYEMKKKLSDTVPTLSEKKLQQFIEIIKQSLDVSNDDEEIELDMDVMDDKTILKLYNFCFPVDDGFDKVKKLKDQLSLFESKVESSDDDDLSSESSEEE